MRSGWFDCTEPSLSSYIVTGETRSAGGCFCNSSGWFKHIEPHRTYSNLCAVVFRVGSMRFDVLEPPRTSAQPPAAGIGEVIQLYTPVHLMCSETVR